MNRSRLLWTALLLACALLSSAPLVQAQGKVAQPAAATAAENFRRALYRYRPVLRFDSGEDFFPVRVPAITDNIGNKLVRGDDANTLIAGRENNDGVLHRGYLRGLPKYRNYPNGAAIRGEDHLDERGNTVSEYLADARDFQRHPSYGDYIYGRIVPIREGDLVTGAWLQYWVFYYYDDFPRVAIGDHEGDWEMVQVRVDADGVPHNAVYAHHGDAAKCTWPKLDTSGARPVVYVALGSHASYFHTGRHGNDFDVDGKQPRRVRKLIRINNSSPKWINWPGFWGNSRGGFKSPKGPKFQSGDVWANPEAFYLKAPVADDCK
jgi:hypothetical protein